MNAANQADADAIELLETLNQAATDADTALAMALANETQQGGEAVAADAAAQELAADNFAANADVENIRLTKVEPRQDEVDQAEAIFGAEDQERIDSDAEADAAEAELEAAEDALDELNP